MTKQLISKIKPLLGVSEKETYEFKFILTELEEDLDDDIDSNGSQDDKPQSNEGMTNGE